MPLDESLDDVADTARDYEDDEPLADTEEPGDSTTDEPEEETLADLAPEVMERVERYQARQREQQRAVFMEIGLDLNQDGRPMIADAQKVSQWAGPVMPAAPPSRGSEPPSPQPQPAAAPPAEEPLDFDPLAADAAGYERFAERIAERTAQKVAAPLLEQIRRQDAIIRRNAQTGAMENVRRTVQERFPEIINSLDHPDFEALYRQQIGQLEPEHLNDPDVIASVAGLVRLKLDPARMPARRTDPAAASLAQNRANRESLGQTPGARVGGAAPPEPGRRDEDAAGVRFLTRMREQKTDAQASKMEVSGEAWRELGEHQDFDSWSAARAARHAREQRSGARRR